MKKFAMGLCLVASVAAFHANAETVEEAMTRGGIECRKPAQAAVMMNTDRPAKDAAAYFDAFPMPKWEFLYASLHEDFATGKPRPERDVYDLAYARCMGEWRKAVQFLNNRLGAFQ